MKVYVLVKYVMPDKGNDGSVSVIGVFDNEDLAEQTSASLQEESDQNEHEAVFYDISEYEMNMVYEPENAEEEDAEALRSLIQSNLVDYTVGEDGEFYFYLTDKGKQAAKRKIFPESPED